MRRKGPAVAHASKMRLEWGRANILREQGERALRPACLEGVDHEKQADRRIRGTACVYAGSVRGAHPVILPPGQMLTRERLAFFSGSRQPREERTTRRA